MIVNSTVIVAKIIKLYFVLNFLVNGIFNDIIAIDLLNKNIDYTSRILIGTICVLKCTSLTTNIVYLNTTEIPINKTSKRL